MNNLRRRSIAIAISALLGAAHVAAPNLVLAQQPAPAAAAASQQQITLARQAAAEGLGAYRTGDFNKALNLFEQAKALYPSAQILRMHGYTLLALERWIPSVEAMESSLESTTGALDDADKKDVADQIAKAMTHIGTITITTQVPGAKLSVDEVPSVDLPMAKPLRFLPGKHKFVVSAPDHTDAMQEVDIEATKAVTVALEPKKIEKG